MKTLLLTLVVVTIVCLDLGYSLICFNQETYRPETTTTCPDGEDTCYSTFWNDHRGVKIERGCGCPRVNPGISIICCKTDKCNN
uniref:Weak neurotoxin WNTX33 n=1 Tax=Ophiophagus hannah TaxID=8665 RepID=3SX3_OPHHA|nr:RecName: Full=Weak neurotoxin WNTX33; AltName: Full=Three-finger toxin; Short=3FTx; Flags: Precursor [Ophiophagus hannah]ABB83636.1 weak neurotoxin precursor [Ophiophagus hannah]